MKKICLTDIENCINDCIRERKTNDFFKYCKLAVCNNDIIKNNSDPSGIYVFFSKTKIDTNDISNDYVNVKLRKKTKRKPSRKYSKDILEKKIEAFNYDGVILYIGQSLNLAKRINQYRNFIKGRSINHAGGRTIAQLKNYEDLWVLYYFCKNQKKIERKLLEEYFIKHGVFPLANWDF